MVKEVRTVNCLQEHGILVLELISN
jgi:hypothetical protein